ncbi:transcriptional regulator [Actinoplanes sp. SE50]|uniref:TetR/AcrR family transcriptional regulator n=1 Tax=unclassified Actinoplanes TaxID=2626549 RepID=UPI00023EC4FD|nr:MULTISPECIES: TetR/AcrR family transcriptional regulator [unclassified Actinoplanes]AEV87026.1 Tetracycline repressor protein class A [Actinoplanes sp. SE50/110]ATO85424.1 transcriptional regulator [Actinoplanes sp. SE50]SLM02836.1 transcriptional regulator, TetR family [Actinoplanes sp. SE50/110]
MGRPPRLSREAIVEAAKRILAEEGAKNLSMRRVAKDLESTPMALYHHVKDKDELLLLLLEAHAGQFPRTDMPDDPRDHLIKAAQLLYDILADCPWIVEVLASDDLMAVSALWIVENIIDGAVRCGMTPEEAVYAYRVIWYYTAGELMLRVAREQRYARPDAGAHREKAFANLDPEQFPRLSSLSELWPALTSRDMHRPGLIAIVDGLLRQTVGR